ncbi:MAG: tRNA (N(6)-L-threonylcarbamoyladenosine(37)-C(2))-methylthiotransferase MtaB [Planctomycetota bacterium]
MHFLIETFGCKVNAYQSAGMRQALEARGYTPSPPGGQAGLVLVNTCTVTARAVARCRQAIRRLRRDHPGARVVVVGCETAADPAGLAAMPEIDAILPYDAKYWLPEALEGGPRPAVVDLFPFHDVVLADHTRGFVQVADGCNAHCTYCIIPRIRGPLQSRPLEAILSEAANLIRLGRREIVLTGIHTGAYGRDTGNASLADVIAGILKPPGEYRVRLSSIEIQEVDDRLLDLMAADPRICPHLAIPLQSGSDPILKAMNRTYTAETYLAGIDAIRRRLPECAVTTDIICGFPGETDDDHAATLRVAAMAGFGRIHAFIYSRRPGTPAADMPGQIPSRVKTDRFRSMTALGHSLAADFARSFIGRTVRVIPEGKVKTAGTLHGYTEHYIPATFDGPPDLIGRIIPVRATAAKGETLICERM